MKEIFKPLKGYEGHYEISNLERIKSIKFKTHRIMKPHYCRGMANYHLSINGEIKREYLSKLTNKKMKHKRYYYILQGEKVGVHTLVEHINEHSGELAERPKAIFKCGRCGNNFKTNILTAKQSKSCGCLKKTLTIDVSDVLELIQKDPFIKIKEIAKELNITVSSAFVYRSKAFKQL